MHVLPLVLVAVAVAGEANPKSSAVPEPPAHSTVCDIGPLDPNRCDVVKQAKNLQCTCDITGRVQAGDAQCCCSHNDDNGDECYDALSPYGDSYCHRICCVKPEFTCGRGCCAQGKVCGFNISNDGSYTSKGCCVDRDASEETQLDLECCRWGYGTDCTKQGGGRCCLRCPEEFQRDHNSPNHQYCVRGEYDKNYYCQVDCGNFPETPQALFTYEIWPQIWGKIVTCVVAALLLGLFSFGSKKACNRVRECLRKREINRLISAADRTGCGKLALIFSFVDYGGTPGTLPHLEAAEEDAKLMTRVFEAMGYIVLSCVNADKTTVEKFLESVEKLIGRGQELVPIYIAGHGQEVNDSFFFYPSGLEGPSPNEEVSLEKWILRFRCALPGRSGGSTILFLIDCCRNRLQPDEAQEAEYRGIVKAEREPRAGCQALNKTMIFWACQKGSFAHDDRIRSQSFFTAAWTKVTCSLKPAERDNITLVELLAKVKDETAALARAGNVSQMPELDPPLETSWPILNSQPLSRGGSSGRAELAASARGSGTGSPTSARSPHFGDLPSPSARAGGS